jgi:carboxypeptidase C (cathepsin A)
VLFLSVLGVAATSAFADPPQATRAEERGSRRNPETRPETRPDAKPEARGATPGDKLSVTEQELTVGGKKLHYRATAGTYQLKDEAGKAKADLFFVAYERTPLPENAADAARRAVTFVFNGGPGAAAVWLHLGTAGPRRVKLTETGAAPPPPYETVDNQSTWLDATDLVFIDPIGTGYSRAIPGEDPKQFYGVDNDLRWVAEFIRLYTTRNQRWPSPKFLAGESYGTTRAAALSEHLLERQGIALNGVILISTVLNFQTISFREGNELPFVLFLPTYTAIAHYHKKLAPELQADRTKALKEAEKFALNEYTAALAAGAGLSEQERADIAGKLSHLTGLPADVVRKANLRIDADLFRKTLLVDQEKIVGRFDGRLTGYDPDPLGRWPDHDPSFNQFYAAYAGAFNDYVRRTLHYESDVSYDVLSGRVQPWDFGRAGNGYLNVADDLEQAMRKSPHTRLMICSGICDLATPYLGATYTLRHMRLSPETRERVTESFFTGGHMLYHESAALEKLHDDVARFIKASIPPGAGSR